MKIFNKNKVNPTLISVIEKVILLFGFLLNIFRKVARQNQEPHIVLVDGFLLGDAILLRPLISALIKKYSKTHKIIFVSGKHSIRVYEDFKDEIKILECQFPWASYDYSMKSWLVLFSSWLFLYQRRTELLIETRGDFRSISWAYLTCPNKIVGFDFTGGRNLLTTIVPDDGSIAHLYDHNKRLASACGCALRDTDMLVIGYQHFSNTKKKIGVSFSGSQPLRDMPRELAVKILCSLIELDNSEIWYIMSPKRDVFCKDELNILFQNRIKIFSGGFSQYFDFLKTIDIYIGMDSGGGHLCSIWGIPSAVIFGTQIPIYTKPVGGHPILCVETAISLKCRPCDGVSCTNPIYKKCLNDIDVDAIVFFAQTHLLKRVIT